MNELLIPFGFNPQGDIVEPENAAKGRSCNCICPGCKAPLLSRHPKAARKHFAHDSQHPDAIPNNHCDLSPYVAMMMMVRHIGKGFEGTGIWLPGHVIVVEHRCCHFLETVSIASSRYARITECDFSTSLGDAVLWIDSQKFIVVEFLHPQKTPLFHLAGDDSLYGVLQIDCTGFPEYLFENAGSDLPYSAIVKRFVLDSHDKHWSYHKLTRAKEAEAFLAHDCPPVNPYSDRFQTARSSPRVVVEQPVQDVEYECVICQHAAVFKSNQEPYCAVCKMTLSMKVKTLR